MDQKFWRQLQQGAESWGAGELTQNQTTESWGAGKLTPNQTTSINTKMDKDDGLMTDYDLESISKATSLSVIMLISLIGNGVILVKVVRYSKMRTVMNAFVCSLSASDLLVTVYSMPLILTYSMTKRWPFGAVMCLFHHYVLTVSAVCGCLIMLYISLDVYIGVIRQSQSKITDKMAGILIAAAWVIALGISVPWDIHDIITDQEMTSNFKSASENVCRIFLPVPNNPEVFRYISLITIGHIIPLIFILFCFVIICSRVYSVHVKIRPSIVPLRDMLFQSEMRTATTVVTVISVYVICWLPYVILLIVSCVSNIELTEFWYDISIWLTWANKAANPTIYALRNKTVLRYLQACRNCCLKSRIRQSEKYVWKGSRHLSSSIVSGKRTGNFSAAMFFARSSIDSDIALTETSGDWAIASLS